MRKASRFESKIDVGSGKSKPNKKSRRGLQAPSFEEVIKVIDKKESEIKEIPKQKSIRKLKSKPQWS
ncbi:hypothetical protein YC2023_112919 [Brassica napus]|uniref:(rape) hypothetical protein n=1 Tax=Brassica napus TaxID=3708 RepID=A0A816IXM7_BRANA|nr:unnamed protein product [Brassica napus]